MSEPLEAPTVTQGCARVVVRTKDGRVFNLGKPSSIFFPLRRWWYLFRRRKEIGNG
jgi:hypothetical protein